MNQKEGVKIRFDETLHIRDFQIISAYSYIIAYQTPYNYIRGLNSYLSTVENRLLIFTIIIIIV